MPQLKFKLYLVLWKFPSKLISFWPLSSPFCSFKIKPHLSLSASTPKELPLPRFVMSKSDAEIRFGNPAELHGKKVQIPYLTTEKNSLKRMDDEDKQVRVGFGMLIRFWPWRLVDHSLWSVAKLSANLAIWNTITDLEVSQESFLCSKKKLTHRNYC